MKKIFYILTLCFFSMHLSAQLPDGSIAPNFEVTDLEGNSYELYELLDQGQSVILDIFATWCPPCWNYHTSNALKDAFEAYGPNGTNELFVFGVEGDGSTNIDCLYGPTDCNDSTFGDWVTGVPYPIVNDNSIAGLYNLPYWPVIYVIYPNRQVYEIGQAPVSEIESWLANKPSLTSGPSPTLINTKVVDAQQDYCTDLVVTAPYYMVSNMGDEEVTSVDISVTNNGQVIYEEIWTGNAGPYQLISEIQLPSEVVFGNAVIELTLSNINGSGSSKSYPTHITLEAKNSITVNTSSDDNVANDNTRYEIQNEDGEVVASQSIAAGMANQSYTHFLANTGCYSIWVYDSGGNGLDAELTAMDQDGNVVYYNDYENDPFEALDIKNFNVASLSNTDELASDLKWSVSPNPVQNQLDLNLTAFDDKEVQVSILSVNGLKLFQRISLDLRKGSNTKSINTSELSNGLYFINIESKGKVSTKRFVKI